ncbi:MAG TPA: EVE domain-containing protein [Thermoanaerobaculia bacterium]|nr:EVE domain-containing protein [Thermoanaerobaculia bacterium]
MAPAKRYWLMKSEPDVYSISDLEGEGRTRWDGVRNYQARNFMRKEMSVGDGVLFHHSSCEPPAIAGVAKVASEAYPDPTQFDRRSKYYDQGSSRDDPRWWLVDIEFVEAFPVPLPLALLKEQRELEGMALLRKGQRLSVQPVTAEEWKAVLKLAKHEAKRS